MNYIYLLLFITGLAAEPAVKTAPPVKIEWYKSRLACEARRIRLTVKGNVFIGECFAVPGAVVPKRPPEPAKEK